MPAADPSIVLIGGAIAGVTIFLGLPVALLRVSQQLRLFLSATSIGILLFLFVEITYQVAESVESAMKLSILGYRDTSEIAWYLLAFVGGFVISVGILLLFERMFIRRNKDSTKSRATQMAVMIAAGIGLHNFSEGLVIGQQLALGSVVLGYLLVVGFALHNATEGFGIAAPLANERPRPLLLLGLGLLGGGPTFLGAVIGSRWTSPIVESLFLSLAAGAILYVVGELIHLGRTPKGAHIGMTAGLLVGFFVAFGTELVIERALTQNFLASAQDAELQMHAGDYFFYPQEIHMQAGRPVKLTIDNRGEVEHEIEFLGMGREIEEVVPWRGRTALLLFTRKPGRYPFLCDIPGHLSRGMRGELVVH